MLVLAGAPLGERFLTLDPSSEAGAGHLTRLLAAGYDDPAALDRLAGDCSVVTYEFERVPAASARRIARRVPVYPNPDVLDVSQDRVTEKKLFNRLGLATPSFAPAASRAELDQAVASVGLPALIKTRREGYDGKGQFVVRATSDVETAWDSAGAKDLIVESMVDFDRELSLLAVRSIDGDTAVYPLVENHHSEGILRLSRAPAPHLTPQLQAGAEIHARAAMKELDYVGVLAIEFFQVGDVLLGNEMAPRVHNSGHWTIEGAVTSQFENHIRAITGRPLGSTAPIGHSAMVNLIGELPDLDAILRVEGAHPHLYGKRPRPGRKLGHVTVVSDDVAELEDRVASLQALA